MATVKTKEAICVAEVTASKSVRVTTDIQTASTVVEGKSVVGGDKSDSKDHVSKSLNKEFV